MTRMMELGRWARYALLAVVGLLVVWGLIALLVQPPSAATEPEVTPEAMPTATPVATAPPASTLPDDPEQRFLAMASDGTLFRGTAGSCASGVAPTLESTTDAAHWTPVLPAGATQLLALTVDPLAPIVADADCAAPANWAAPEALPDRTLAADEGYSAVFADDCPGVVFMGEGFSICDQGLSVLDPIGIDFTGGTLYFWSGGVLGSHAVS